MTKPRSPPEGYAKSMGVVSTPLALVNHVRHSLRGLFLPQPTITIFEATITPSGFAELAERPKFIERTLGQFTLKKQDYEGLRWLAALQGCI
jgi:hypothetical protein